MTPASRTSDRNARAEVGYRLLMPAWIEEHKALLFWLAGFSIVCLLATLIIVPAILVRIPSDYFAHEHRPPGVWVRLPSWLRLAYLIAKNTLGVIFVLAGLAMLVLPGQGLLTLLIGFLMVDGPGKYRLEKWVISRPFVMRSVNWLRRRYGRAPLRIRKERNAPKKE